MSPPTPDESPFAAPDFLSGGGEMGALMRGMDWSETPLGPASAWSPSLKMMARFLLANRFPLLLWWGPEFCQLYNDAYRPILGVKHPMYLGRPVRECWSEIWHILRPLIETPFHGGPSTWMEDILLEINRYGFVEETHFTIAYSPVPEETVESGIGGVLATVHEISEKVVAERRVVALRDLGAPAVEARTAEEACAAAAEMLARHPRDVPFALLYLIDADGRSARLAGAAGVAAGGPASPPVIALGEPAVDSIPGEPAASDPVAAEPAWPLAAVARAEAPAVVDDLPARFGAATPPGPWADPPRQAVVVPIRSNMAHQLAGLLVAGVSPRLRLDDSYRSFLDLAASQIAAVVASARAHEDERRRAEALAELDRAKTTFFSNVSHELRTPLTLILGPLEEALATGDGGLPPAAREPIELAHRNGLRLLKLVNTLLDFSRIEAGRAQAVYRPVDLAALTAELASVFRSAVELAGLRLAIDCRPLSAPVYADREMWEKIVLNLLSNALKFTFDGEIETSLVEEGEHVVLRVRDTGVGIPEDELLQIFERFHRVKGTRGRTHEGTGIGLALVQELVRLHGGTVTVESAIGKGTTFAVAIPKGREHLPPDHVDEGPATAVSEGGQGGGPGATPFLDEALRWLPPAPLAPEEGLPLAQPAGDEGLPPLASSSRPAARILLADDNADMREYVRRLLAPRYEVEAVADGLAALDVALARPPDLVLSDVMMPRLDGFGLLRALRDDPRTKTVPVVLLSARAGEESRVEGLEAGADDYLVKPFSARELSARVRANLEMAQLRKRAAEERDRLLAAEQAARRDAEEASRLKDEFLATVSHELRTPLNAILGWVHLLRSGQLDAASAARAVETVERNARSQQQLIEDLLDVSRIISGKLRLDVRPCDPSSFIEAAIEAVKPAAEAKGVRLQKVMDSRTGLISGDPDRLQQVVWNLLSNAIKFTPKGGRVQVRLERIDSHVEIVVTDTGTGIRAEFLPQVFDRFRQADGTTTRAHGGLGLGLAIVRHLVELHGGTVRADSHGDGQGATFTVMLPLIPIYGPIYERGRREGSASRPEDGAPLPAPDPCAVSEDRLDGLRVLVVDDEPGTRELLEILLARCGATVATAGSAAAALAELERARFDALVSDIGMPEVDGYELIRRVRGLPEEGNGKISAVALTAYARAEDRLRALRSGYQMHVTKPVDPAELIAVLAALSGR